MIDLIFCTERSLTNSPSEFVYPVANKSIAIELAIQLSWEAGGSWSIFKGYGHHIEIKTIFNKEIVLGGIDSSGGFVVLIGEHSDRVLLNKNVCIFKLDTTVSKFVNIITQLIFRRVFEC